MDIKIWFLVFFLAACSSEMVSVQAVSADASVSVDVGSIQPNLGCQKCDDQNLCTIDSCQAGQCHYEPVYCGHDGGGYGCCNIFFCEQATGQCLSKPDPDCEGCGGAGVDVVTCQDTADCPLEDNKCLPQVCEQGSCVWRALECDDHNPCTNDACKKDVGCLHQPIPNCK